MRIGGDGNFLTIECLYPDPQVSVWRVEAEFSDKHVRFSATHDRICYNFSQEDPLRFDEFAAGQRNFFELQLSDDGWLRSERNARGWITVRYRIASRKDPVDPKSTPAALEGEVTVEGEFTLDYCRQLKALLHI